MELSELVGKRILVAENSRGYGQPASVKELKILELSPSGSWVKVMDHNGTKYWLSKPTLTPVEVLETLEKRPTP